MSEKEIAISVNSVAKYFEPSKGRRSLKQAFISLLTPKKKVDAKDGYWALSDISFNVSKGEFFGIVGRNGSGKSTLLKMIAGVYLPTKGKITVSGKLVPFIELGVGFNPELSGKDNVFLNGALLGFNRKEMAAMYNSIVSFAELEEHMDVKLKNYSSGMQVRLAFSIAIRAKSDVLLIDEVLAVGDAAFQSKCIDYFYKLKREGATVIFVSHDKTTLERFCSEGILIDEGHIVKSGKIKDVLKAYSSIILDELDEAGEEDAPKSTEARSEYATILKTETLTDENQKTKKFKFGDTIIVETEIKIKQDILNPIFGITIWEKNLNKPVLANNTYIDGSADTGLFKKDDVVSVRQVLPRLMNDGTYFVEPAICNDTATIFYDQKPEAATFYIAGSDNPYAVFSVDSRIGIQKR